MKLYIHKDIFYPDTWWVKFKWLLDKRYKDIDYEIVNLHFENNINDLQLGNDDWCICRFAHYEEDFELSKRVYPILHEKFKGRIWPSKEDWYYYNDKQRQLEFFEKNNVPHPISHYSYGRDDFLEWVNENNLEYPIVVKKSQGAGSEKVNLIKKWKEVDFPVIAQEYIDVDYDIRIAFINNKVLFLKRFHQWKTKNKDNFPYGTDKKPIEKKLKYKLAPYEEPRCESLDEKEILKLLPIVNYLHDKFNTISIGWDIIGDIENFKVLEFSYIFQNELRDCKSYYDMKTNEIKNLVYDKRLQFTFIQNEILKSIKETSYGSKKEKSYYEKTRIRFS
jgi:hypothetical protein